MALIAAGKGIAGVVGDISALNKALAARQATGGAGIGGTFGLASKGGKIGKIGAALNVAGAATAAATAGYAIGTLLNDLMFKPMAERAAEQIESATNSALGRNLKKGAPAAKGAKTVGQIQGQVIKTIGASSAETIIDSLFSTFTGQKTMKEQALENLREEQRIAMLKTADAIGREKAERLKAMDSVWGFTEAVDAAAAELNASVFTRAVNNVQRQTSQPSVFNATMTFENAPKNANVYASQKMAPGVNMSMAGIQ